MAEDAVPVLAILTAKSGWFRRDDELAAHERAIRSLGWSVVTLPVRAGATADELAAFAARCQPSLIWIRDGVPRPDGFPTDALAAPTIAARPRGVDGAILDAAVGAGPPEVAGDVTVMTSTPSAALRDAVARLRAGDGTTVVTYGAGWGGDSWFEPDGRAGLVALASAPVHLAELGPEHTLPHSVYRAAAVGAVPLVLDDGDGTASVPREVLTAGSVAEVAARVTELRADRARLDELARAAGAWVAGQRLEPQWRSILDAHGAAG
jgi:hypothetical protein